MANGHGGPRKGSGRKFGSATTRTREVANKVVAKARITPLEVMVEAMEAAYQAGELRAAAALAEKAAPYVHPRLSSISAQQTVQGSVTLQVVTGIPREVDA